VIQLEANSPPHGPQSPPAATPLSTAQLIEALTRIVGAANIISSQEELAGWSADIYRRGVPAELVVSPASVEEVAAVVGGCTGAGRAVIPLGGGFSYTGGYLAVRPQTVIVNLRRLDRIVEINTEDMYVTVEAGCTWKTLLDALQAKGVRTPYFGPISGFASTVGGALSQGSFFMGSTQYGTTAETTLGLELVLADGSLLRTGSGATPYRPSPWFRSYGPDLTGLFLGDTGALGFKVRATLKLIPAPQVYRYATYAFNDPAAVLRVVGEIARRGLAADCYAWDPYIVDNFAKRDVNVAQGLEYLAGVVKSGSSMFKGLKDAARIAVAGHRFARDAEYLVHATVDETIEAAADAKIEAIGELLTAAGGVATEPSVPRALRGLPFSYPNRILGLKGERWVPTNALVPHSRASEVLAAFRHYMQSNDAIVKRFGFEFGIIFFAVGNNTLCIEPLLYWPDARLPSHERLMQPDYLKTMPPQPENAESREAMRMLRLGLSELFMRMGCVHVQIGKFYRYKESRDPATWALLQFLKSALDPRGLMNPGSLGL
jgi:FAD/FMN-containing dehydrogenase